MAGSARREIAPRQEQPDVLEVEHRVRPLA